MRGPVLATLALTVFAFVLVPAASATAPPWIWDQDRDGIDDRIVDVETNGITAAFENGDLAGRRHFDVVEADGVFTYGLFVKYDRPPTEADELALQGLGLDTHRYRYIHYVRTRATFARIPQILAQDGVIRVETMPYMYPVNDNGTRSMQAAPSDFSRFPSVSGDLGLTGRGVVVAVLDTGVNDQPDSAGSYPGHESLSGKFVGGGIFDLGQPETSTGLNESENPFDGAPDFSHGSHVAGSAIGTGGPVGHPSNGVYGFYRGVAPDARLVDCKVLTDAGTGLGSADALEWCIFNKDNDWGLTGGDAVYRGIQVVNMSLGGSQGSDGTDANSAAVNAAAKAGLVVCVATGNDGNSGYMPSPAAADLAISVGATVDSNTLDRLDDVVAGFSNEGPRAADADGDQTDEMKPAVCAPGGGVTSVEGVRTSDGQSYTTTNGTSMACPMTAGVAALIVEACPGISPREVRRILQDTADHRVTGGKQPPGAVDPFGIDPNYHPSWGWGNVNAYAAVMESRFPNRTQVVLESGEPVLGGIDVRWTTQREVDLLGFHVLRADPVYGEPGPFVQITTGLVSPTGDPFIHADDNRTDYVYGDRDPGLVPGETYWYRVRWKDVNGRLHDEPAFPVCYLPPTPIATIEWSITHNTLDNDLLVYIGSGTDVSDPVNTAQYFFPAPGTGAADTSYSVPGEATTGNLRHEWSLTLTDKDPAAAQFLPPSADDPWFLWVNEAGFINRTGKIEDFRITYHVGGDQVFAPLTPFPVPLAETQTSTVWIPSDPGLNPLNHAPVLDPIGDREAQEGGMLEFTVSGSDPDGDPLAFAAQDLPAGASFDPGTRTFSWSPDHSAVAATTVFDVTFSVDDGQGGNDSETVGIRLHDVDPADDLPPYFDPLNDRSVVGGNTLAFKVSGRDPENATLTYGAQTLPVGASFDPGTRTFTWNTAGEDVGEHMATFTLDDGTNPDVTETVQITVKGAIPPALGACESEVEVFPGSSSIGSADLGTADLDTVEFACAVPAVRLIGTLGWTNASSDLDITVYDADGNSVGGAASLANPEVFIIDNLPAGTYRAVVEGFLVLAPTDWTLEIDKCLTAPTPVALSHFTAHPGEGAVRLEWATSEEENHTGFHLYRSVHEEDGFERINADLIRGSGVYQFEDADPPAAEAGAAWYRLGALSRDGAEQLLGPWRVDLASLRPSTFRLAQNFPNPFGADGTRIRYRLPEDGRVRLQVFDVRGALVRTLADGPRERGEHEQPWDGLDDAGRLVSTGLYFYRLQVPGRYVETRRMMVAR